MTINFPSVPLGQKKRKEEDNFEKIHEDQSNTSLKASSTTTQHCELNEL